MSLSSLSLNDGTTIPDLAWGTVSKGPEQLALALKLGLRHIDTAQGYNNEQETGDAIKQSGIDRNDIYLTTKLSQKNGRADLDPIPLSTVRESVLGSIKRLGTQPNLLLVHNPFVPESGKQIEFYQVLEKMIDDGELTASLGVSNYRPQDLEALLKVVKHKPVVNQLEYHPYVLSHLAPVLAICEQHDIRIEAYGPLTPVLRHSQGPLEVVLARISARLSESTGQEVDASTVLLLWTKQKGVVAVTSSANEARMTKLVEVASLKPDLLTKEEVEEIEAVGKQVHFRNYDEHMTVDFPAPDLPKTRDP